MLTISAAFATAHERCAGVDLSWLGLTFEDVSGVLRDAWSNLNDADMTANAKRFNSRVERIMNSRAVIFWEAMMKAYCKHVAGPIAVAKAELVEALGLKNIIQIIRSVSSTVNK